MAVMGPNPRESRDEARERLRQTVTGLSGTNLERAGDHNQRVTLHAIRVNSPITRTDLADITGLTAPAIANITKRLLKDKLIMAAGRMHGARGQPATKLVINPDSCYSIGLNVDRDHITIVLLDFAGRVRARASREIAFAMPDVVQGYFRRSLPKLIAKAGVDAKRLVGVGVAFPDDMARLTLPNQPVEYAAWGGVNIAEMLGEILPLPVFAENDAAAAAMGEMQFGLGHQYRSFFYLLVTAGLGGGLVIEGNYFRGAQGRSGEVGLLRGAGGPIQDTVSLSALYSRLAAAGVAVASPSGLNRLDDTGKAIVDAWLDASVATLADTMLAINCLINPEAVLIGGRLPAELVDRLAAGLTTALQPFAATMPAVAPVLRAQLSDDAPAVGAAILPFSDRFLPTRLALMKNTAA